MYLLSSAMSGWVCLPVCCCGWGTKVQYVAQLGRNFSQFLSGSCLQLHSSTPDLFQWYHQHKRWEKTRNCFSLPLFRVHNFGAKKSSRCAFIHTRQGLAFTLLHYYITTLLYYNNIYNNVHILDSRYLQFSWSLTKAWSWLRAQSSATQSIAWHN